MKTQIATTIEQSKKLLALGISPESADMGWYYSKDPQMARNQMWLYTKGENSDIPAWSLSALLELIPENVTVRENDGYEWPANRPKLVKLGEFWEFGHTWGSRPISRAKTTQKKDALLAVYEYLVWLLENSFIKPKGE